MTQRKRREEEKRKEKEFQKLIYKYSRKKMDY